MFDMLQFWSCYLFYFGGSLSLVLGFWCVVSRLDLVCGVLFLICRFDGFTFVLRVVVTYYSRFDVVLGFWVCI